MSALVVLVLLLCVVIAVWSWLRQYPNAPPEFPGAHTRSECPRIGILGHSLRVLGDRKRYKKIKDDLTKEDLTKLVYLEAVIKESMRLYPSVSLIAGEINQDVKLKNCTLRAGSHCIIGVYAVYGLLRHPMWGPDEEQFRPERWLNPALLPDHPSLKAAFGVGKRNCIGSSSINTRMRIGCPHIFARMSVLAVSVILICVVIAVWSRLRRRPNAPPELPGALPIIGHSLQLLGDRKHLWNFIRRFQISSLENSGVVEWWVFTHSLYTITDPEDSLTVANSCLNKPFIYDFAKEFVNNGLITAEESVWKSHRKLLNPAFNQQVLNTYVNEMNVQARSLVSRLALKADKGTFDVRKFFITYTLSTVTRTTLGLNTHDQTTIDTDYAEGIEDLFALYCDRFQKVWLQFSFIFNWSAMKCKQTIILKKLKNIIDPVIYKRKSELKTTNDRNMYDDSKSGKFKPVLDKMLHLTEDQDAFTDSDIREHLDTFVAAAYDTTSSALTFILLVIGSDRDMQERIFKELQDVLEHEDKDLTKQDLPKLVYLDAVIKESMRMYPSVPLIARKVDKDINLRNCTLRAGNTCMIGVYGLLRHPMWGPDAEQFRPERWLNSATLPDHPGLNAAFGIGKRNCIGKIYGMMVMKVALAHILRRYRVTGDINKVVCEFDVVLKPVEGHLISLALRS